MRYFSLFLLAFFGFQSKSQTPINLDSTYMYSSNGNKVLIKDSLFNDSSDKYIIIYNSVNCKGCIEKINHSIDSLLLRDSLAKIYTFTTTKGTQKHQLGFEVERIKETIKKSQFIFFDPIVQSGLFDIKYSDSGIFNQFKIDITPCIIRYRGGQLVYYSYKDLFPSKYVYNSGWCNE